MTRIAPVNMAFNPKTLWFDAGDFEIEPDAHVVVETNRGVELGQMAGTIFEPSDEQVEGLPTELKPVLRIATEDDIACAAENEERAREAMKEFREIAAYYNEEMHPVAVEFLLEGDKAVFYFESEKRLDFREIVRELAARFHVRIDMRQIGVRDQARMVGGIGHCGQELCCKRLGGEFNPVSIRMAKEQDLSLNPQKISGICGRLMCCLRYEYDAYKDFKGRAPKQNATIQTPDGPAKVSNLDVPREIVDLKIEIEGKTKTVHVPLSDFEPPEEGANRPKSIGTEAWETALHPPEVIAESALFLTSQFTGKDVLGDAHAVRRNKANVKNATGSKSMVDLPEKGSSRRRRRTRSTSADAATGNAAAADTGRVRRRRSTTVAADGSKETKAAPAEDELRSDQAEHAEERPARRRRTRSTRAKRADAQPAQDAAPQEKTERRAIRPGHKSSALAQAHDESRDFDDSEEQKPKKRRRRGSRGGRNRRSAQDGAAAREKSSEHRSDGAAKEASAGAAASDSSVAPKASSSSNAPTRSYLVAPGQMPSAPGQGRATAPGAGGPN